MHYFLSVSLPLCHPCTLILLHGNKIKANYTLHHYTQWKWIAKTKHQNRSQMAQWLYYIVALLCMNIGLFDCVSTFRRNSNEFYGKPKHAKRTLRLNWALLRLLLCSPCPSLSPNNKSIYILCQFWWNFLLFIRDDIHKHWWKKSHHHLGWFFHSP